MLLSADGVGTLSIMRQVGCAKATVCRWQERFMAAGVDGLLRDQSRPPGKAPLPEAVVERGVELALGEPRGEATHWTGRAMAEASPVTFEEQHARSTVKPAASPLSGPRAHSNPGLTFSAD